MNTDNRITKVGAAAGNCNSVIVISSSQTIAKPTVSCRAKRFDFKSFKKYVETYDPIKNGGNKAEIIFEDMLYGLGLAVDKKHQWSDGFRQFKKWMSARLHGS